MKSPLNYPNSLRIPICRRSEHLSSASLLRDIIKISCRGEKLMFLPRLLLRRISSVFADFLSTSPGLVEYFLDLSTKTLDLLVQWMGEDEELIIEPVELLGLFAASEVFKITELTSALKGSFTTQHFEMFLYSGDSLDEVSTGDIMHLGKLIAGMKLTPDHQILLLQRIHLWSLAEKNRSETASELETSILFWSNASNSRGSILKGDLAELRTRFSEKAREAKRRYNEQRGTNQTQSRTEEQPEALNGLNRNRTTELNQKRMTRPIQIRTREPITKTIEFKEYSSRVPQTVLSRDHHLLIPDRSLTNAKIVKFFSEGIFLQRNVRGIQSPSPLCQDLILRNTTFFALHGGRELRIYQKSGISDRSSCFESALGEESLRASKSDSSSERRILPIGTISPVSSNSSSTGCHERFRSDSDSSASSGIFETCSAEDSYLEESLRLAKFKAYKRSFKGITSSGGSIYVWDDFEVYEVSDEPQLKLKLVNVSLLRIACLYGLNGDANLPQLAMYLSGKQKLQFFHASGKEYPEDCLETRGISILAISQRYLLQKLDSEFLISSHDFRLSQPMRRITIDGPIRQAIIEGDSFFIRSFTDEGKTKISCVHGEQDIQELMEFDGKDVRFMTII